MKGRVLIVAGSDSGGGAGIQGDIKTVTALGGYAATAITALTAQNTQGVFGVHPVPLDFIEQQIRLTIDDIGCDAIKTGMLAASSVIDRLADVLNDRARNVPLVVDPVMVAKGGASLLEADAARTLIDKLIPLATVITPNIPEAETLLGIKIETRDSMSDAAQSLLKTGARAVLLKGGHLDTGDGQVHDLLADSTGTEMFSAPRIDSFHTHGTGCALASAVATGLAQGMTLPQAVQRARDYVHTAIRTAPGYGSGHGPLNHGHTVRV